MVISSYSKIALLLTVLLLTVLTTQIISAQELPQMPDVYSGTAKLSNGANMPDGTKIAVSYTHLTLPTIYSV